MSAPFDKIYITPHAEDILITIAMHQEDVYRCLKKLFTNILQGVADIGPDILEPDLHAVDGCGFTVFVSFNKSSEYIQIDDLIFPARNGLRGVF